MAEERMEPGYGLQSIVARLKGRSGKVWYFVKWLGLPEKENSWEPAHRLREVVPEAVDKFERDHDANGRNQETFQVCNTEILAKRIHGGRLEYQVSRNGLDDAVIKWETFEDSIKDFPGAVERFELKREQKVRVYVSKMKFEKQDAYKLSTSASNKMVKGSRRTAELIYGISERKGNRYFLVKWQGTADADIVPCSLANLLWPEVVIDFYEERLTWDKAYFQDGEQFPTPESCSVDGEAEKILGVAEKDGEIYFIIKWKDSVDASFLPRSEASLHWPQMVIGFYEQSLTEDGSRK